MTIVLPIPHLRFFFKFHPTRNVFGSFLISSSNYFFYQNKLQYRIPKSMPTQLSQCIKLDLNICESAIWDTVTVHPPLFFKIRLVSSYEDIKWRLHFLVFLLFFKCLLMASLDKTSGDKLCTHWFGTLYYYKILISNFLTFFD